METDFLLDKFDLAKLTELQLSSNQRLELLKQHEYTEGICHKLKTNLSTGLTTTSTDLEARRLKFGTNQVREQPARSFLYLVWLALHDNLLIVLLVCASISISLSFPNFVHKFSEFSEDVINIDECVTEVGQCWHLISFDAYKRYFSISSSKKIGNCLQINLSRQRPRTRSRRVVKAWVNWRGSVSVHR